MSLDKIRFSNLQRFTFFDKDDIEIGSAVDLLLETNSLEPISLLMGAGFFEELMEEMGRKENQDEIAPLSLIENLDDKNLKINAKLQDLELTDDNGDPYFDCYKLSKLKSLESKDLDDGKDWILEDFLINNKNSYFTFTNTKIDSEMKRFNYGQRFEIYITINSIEIKENLLIIKLRYDDIISQIKETLEAKDRGKSIIYFN